MADHRLTAEELAALQPTDAEMQEVRDLDLLQQIVARVLRNPAEAAAASTAPKGILTVLEYMGLCVVRAFQQSRFAEETGPAADEFLYGLCRVAFARLDTGDVNALLEELEERDAAAGGVMPAGAAAPPSDALIRDLRTLLAEKEREAEELRRALEDTRNALRQMEDEMLNRRQSILALEALQQLEDGPPPDEEKPAAGETPAAPRPQQQWWQLRRPKTPPAE